VQRRDIAFALFIALVWGLNFVAVKWVVDEFPPMMANMLRFMAVMVLLFPFLRIVQGRMKPLLVAAFTLGVAHFGMVFLGMALSGGVGAVAIASQLNVPFSTILAILILKETVGWKRVAGLVLSFAGVMVIGFDPIVFNHWQGLVAIIFAALLYSLSAVMMRQLKDVPAVTVQAWVGVAGILGSSVISLAFEVGQVVALHNAKPLAWMAVIYSGVASSVIGHGGANYLFRKYEISVVTPYFLMVPLFAILGAVIVLGETLSAKMILGGTLTIVGILIVTLRNRAKAKEE